ncbi:DUF305 domain-containing protein [Actinoplanes auranticolor]|uniref:DUF305 domain-containing protein n=1 Tax=Actinoplanes auranticolor TaxID=47988 RepID=A0A919S4Q2_9ACTN|nr:DUF305 domain-containing protein [Actinoplanes auranticolor]GIM64281.1 hypothetical protein Aau02nite_09420 [Actinoplanes auranticolor]
MSIALRAVAGGCLMALLLGAGACDSGASPAAPPAVSSSKAPGSSGFFGGTDLAWVEITIAMNEELLPLLALAPTHASDPGLRALAAEVRATHEQELGTLRSLHDEAGLPAENPHKGMPMPGMVTPEQVAEAAAARGAAFDKLLAQHLRAHLEQGVKLAESEEKAGLEPRTKDLAARVVTGRRQFLAELPAPKSSGK